jgi:hypothetical protein
VQARLARPARRVADRPRRGRVLTARSAVRRVAAQPRRGRRRRHASEGAPTLAPQAAALLVQHSRAHMLCARPPHSTVTMSTRSTQHHRPPSPWPAASLPAACAASRPPRPIRTTVGTAGACVHPTIGRAAANPVLIHSEF